MANRPSDIMSTSMSSATTASLTKKVNKMLQNDIENDKDALDALRALSSVFGPNTPEERRNLRPTIEQGSLNVNAEFLASFGRVKQLLDKIAEDCADVQANCAEICKQLDQTTLENRLMLEEGRKLKQEAEVNEIKQSVIKLFLDNFGIGPEKADQLRSPKTHSDYSNISARTFQSLERINQIHEQSKLLLQTQSEQQERAMELMELCGLFHEAAFERIYKWTQHALRTVQPEDLDLIQDAIRYLEQKPVLIEHCLEEYITVRRSAFVRSFIDALTRGSGSKKPLDLLSTDPVKYVNEIFTWLHMNLATEKSNLQALFRKSEQRQSEQLDRTIRNSLSSITEGFSRPARYRIEQQLVSGSSEAHSANPPSSPTPGKVPQTKSTPTPHNLYRIKNLIQFYTLLLTEQLNPDCDLIVTLHELEQLAERMFINALNFVCASRLGKNSATGEAELLNSDLSVPQSFSAISGLVRELFGLYQTSPTRDQSEKDLGEVLSVTLNPLIKWIRIWASKMSETESAIFQLNCLNQLRTVLEIVKDQTSEHLLEIERQIEEQIQILIGENSSYIISHLGLSPLISAIRSDSAESPKQPLSNELGCDSIALRTASKNLDNFLAAPNSVSLPQMDLLLSSESADRIRTESLEQFCSSYELIHERINQAESGYDAETIGYFHHSPANVRTLLSQ